MSPEQRQAYKLLMDAGGKLVRQKGGHGMWKLKGHTFALPHHTAAWKGHRGFVYIIKTRTFIKRVEAGTV